MGNEIKKESDVQQSKKPASNEALVEELERKILIEANITGSNWEELENNLDKHIAEPEMLEKEWECLQEKDELVTQNESLFTVALSPYNKGKNRYMNILPYDSTRVILSPIEGVNGSDYINANWVTSGERVYICTQAPLEHTLNDFHRMLWESHPKALVMLTKHVELGRVKAHDYLPQLGEPKIFGDIKVEVISNEPSKDDTYIIRKIILTKGEEKHDLIQFHFTAWPDHGVPDVTEPILSMALTVDEMCPPSQSTIKSPTIVHCSAGVGRTGTYVIINSVLEQITNHMKNNPNEPPTINMAKTLHDLRKMRCGMVNHFDQYKFCYKTILSHIQHLIKERNNQSNPKTKD